MDYKPKVKAGRIQHLTDARYFAVWAPDYMSFALDEGSPDFVSPQDYRKIASWVEGPEFIAELGIHQTAEATDIIQTLDLDGVQFHPLANPEEFRDDGKHTYFYTYVLEGEKSTDWDHIRQWAKGGAQIILDFQTNRIDWTAFLKREGRVWKDVVNEWPVYPILHPDLHPVMEILMAHKPWGLELRGSAEEKLGVKSFEELDPLFDTFDKKGWLVV